MEDTITQEIVTISPFEKTKEELIAFVSDYKNLVVTDDTFEEAKKARLILRDMRYAIQATEKANTERLNEFKNKNWDRSKELVAVIVPTEEAIDAGIKAIENRKAAIKAEKERIEREKVEAEIKAEQERLASVERERVAAIEAAQKAESERLEKLQAEIDERNKIEQERLNQIKAEQEKQQAVIRAEQLRIAKEQAEHEAKIKAEQEAIDRQKRDIEEARQREANEKIRIAELEQARKDAAEKAIAEAEAKAKREAEELAYSIECEKREAARQEALKPDKQKLQDLSHRIYSILLPELKDPKAAAIAVKASVMINEVVQFIDTELENL